MRSEQSQKLSGISLKSGYGRYLALLLAVLILGTWELARNVRQIHAQTAVPRLYLSAARQVETSYKGSAHARQAMSARASALSMTAGDLDGDAISDLAIGFATPGGGTIAIHHGNLDAFAPQSERSFWAMERGEFPSPYLTQADLIEIPVRPDFLAEGDLIGLKGSALAAAARGGNSVAVLSRDDSGAMQVQQTIVVPGSITAMDVHDLAGAKFGNLVVGVRTANGPQLLVYTGSHAGLSQTGVFPLSGEATSFVSGDLDGDGVPDLLLIAGGQISILHSRGQVLEPIPIPFTVSAAVVGRFLHDRDPLLQMALLATDGSLHIMAEDNFDSTPFTPQEMQGNRRAQITQMLARKHSLQAAPTPVPAPRPAVTWKDVESSPGVGVPDSSGKAPLLFRTRVSNYGADDVLLMSSAKLTVLAHPTSQPSQVEVQDRPDLGADAIAAKAVRVNIDGRPGLVYITPGRNRPTVISTQAGVTYNVNTTADALNAGACAAATANQCTLREAIVEANAQSQVATINIPNGTYTLTIGRAGAPTYDAKTGTLDVTTSVNLVGSSQANTIIQAGTRGANDVGGPNGVDKVFSFNQDITAFSNATVAVSNLTIQNGRNLGNESITDGWGGAFDCDTGSSGNASVTLTDVTLNNNTLTEGEGAGFANFNSNGGTGLVTVTGSLIENNINQANSTSGAGGDGGGIAVEAPASLTMSTTTVSGNQLKAAAGVNPFGAGIYDVGSGLDVNSTFHNNQVALHGVTITNNTSAGPGAGITTNGGGLTIDQESVISNNTAGGDGGGMLIGIYSNNNNPAFTVSFSNITVTGNQATGYGGGIKLQGGFANTTGFTMNYSRISGNSGVAGQGRQLSWEEAKTSAPVPTGGQAIDIRNNWWGTNLDPTITSDPAIEIDPNGDSNGTVNYTPYIVFTLDTPSPLTVKINAISILTADVAHDSTGSTSGLSGHLAVFSGLPVTFSSGSGGSITTAQPAAIASDGSGQAISIFQAGAAATTANVSATFDGATISSNVFVVQPPAMTMSFSPTPVKPNTASTLTFGITNGNTVGIDANFSDALPSGLLVASPPSVTNGCAGTVTATAGASSISFTNASLAVGTCTIQVNVIASVDNTYTDSATIDSTAAGNGNTPSATLTVSNPPTLVKTFSPASIPLNGTTTMSITLSSTNTNLSLTGVGFVDTLPSGLAVASPSNLNNTCSGTATAVSNVSLSGASLLPGTNCAVTVTMKGTTAAAILNSVTPTSTNGGNGTAGSATLTVVAPPTIAKSFGVSAIALNASTSLSFTLSNPNSATNSTLTGVGFTDNLPAGLKVASPSNGLTGSCGAGTISATAGGTTVGLSGATLTGTGGGSSCTFSVNVTGTAGGQQNNVTSAVTSTEGGTGLTASASVNVEAPPSISKAFASGSIALNASTNLTFTITNPTGNPVSLTGVGFTDTIPTGLTVASASSSQCGGTLTVTAPVTIALANATVAVGTPCTFSVLVTGATGGAYTNTTGNVTSTNGGTGNTATANLSVGTAPAISKGFNPTSVSPGGTSTLTFGITNPSASLALTGLAFTDTFPSGMVVAATPNTANTCGGSVIALSGAGSVSLSGGSLAASGSCAVSVIVQGNSAGTLSNSVQVTSTNGGTGNTANASLVVVSPPTIGKSFGAPSIAVGSSTSLSFSLQNNNAATTLHGIGFTDSLPSVLLISSPSNGLTGSCGGGTITATAGASSLSLAGAVLASSASCTFSVSVTGTVAGTQNNVTSAVTSTEGGTGLTASASVNVEAPPAISKAFANGAIVLNASTNLTFTIINPAGNPASLTGVAFTDTLPTGLTVASASSSQCGGTLTVSAPVTIALANATVAVGTPCTFSVSVTGAVAGSYTNTTGNVTSTNGGMGNTASANLSVGTAPAISKSFSPTSVALGGTSTLTLTITNPNASVALTGVAFSDTFPSGMVVASSPGTANTCGGSVTATGGAGSVSLSGGSLAASASCAVSVSVQGNSAGTLSNSVQVTSTNAGTGNTSNANLLVVSPPTIGKAFGAPSIAVGGATSLSFTLQNNNAATTLHGIGFTDALPSGLLISSPNGLTGSCGGGIISATGGASSLSLSGAVLASGASCTFSVNVTGTAAGTQNNVTLAVTSTEGGTGTTASASVNVEAPPALAKAFGAASIALNASTSLTFTITNPTGNPASLAGVAFTDTLPTGLTVASATSSQCGGTLTVIAPVTIALANATVATGTPCTFAVLVTGASPGGYTNTTGNVTSSNGGTGSTATAQLTVASPTAVTVTNVTSTTANGSYTVGAAAIPIQVTFSAPVTVIGTPTLTLNSGGTAFYASGSGAATLTFNYTIGAGQTTSGGHLDASSATALSGTIQDSGMNPATLSVPVGGTSGSLSSNKAIVIDTTAPTVVSYWVLFGSQRYNVIGSSRTRLPWEITGIQVVFSKPIAQANANSLSGVTVTNFAGLGTNTLTWTISPVDEANLSTVLAGTGGNTIADAAGNALAGGSGFTQNLKILWADFNDDGVVNSQDAVLVGQAQSQTYNILADLNGDGVVNAADVQIARLRVGTSLP